MYFESSLELMGITKMRRASEQGKPFAPARDLFPE